MFLHTTADAFYITENDLFACKKRLLTPALYKINNAIRLCRVSKCFSGRETLSNPGFAFPDSMTSKTTGKAREVSHAEQVCTDMFLHDVKRTIVLWAAVYHAQQYGNTGRWTCLQRLRQKKKKNTAGDNGSLLFSRLCCLILGSGGELDYTQKRVKILAT